MRPGMAKIGNDQEKVLFNKYQTNLMKMWISKYQRRHKTLVIPDVQHLAYLISCEMETPYEGPDGMLLDKNEELIL